MQIIDNIAILEFLAILVKFIQIRRHQRIFADQDNFEMIMLSQMWLQIIADCLQFIRLVLTYLRCKRKKKKLFKPHLLLRYLGGYR